jgi:hypothetical protein
MSAVASVGPHDRGVRDAMALWARRKVIDVVDRGEDVDAVALLFDLSLRGSTTTGRRGHGCARRRLRR